MLTAWRADGHLPDLWACSCSTRHGDGTTWRRHRGLSFRVFSLPAQGPSLGPHLPLPRPVLSSQEPGHPRSGVAQCAAFMGLSSSSGKEGRPYVASGPGLPAISSSHFPGWLLSGLVASWLCSVEQPLSLLLAWRALGPCSTRGRCSSVVAVCCEACPRAHPSLTEWPCHGGVGECLQTYPTERCDLLCRAVCAF